MHSGMAEAIGPVSRNVNTRMEKETNHILDTTVELTSSHACTFKGPSFCHLISYFHARRALESCSALWIISWRVIYLGE